MKIAFVLDDRLDKPDGVQQYVRQLGEWLSGNGHEVDYLVGESPSLKDQNVHHLSKTIRVRFNKNRMEVPLPASGRRIKALLNEKQFDVLHVQMPYSPLLASRVIARAPQSTAIVGTFHILPYARLERAATKALGFVVRRSKRKFDRIFSVSDAAQDFARKTFGVDSKVLPNVVRLAEFSKGKRLAKYSDRTNIVFLGRLVPRKGARQLLKAFERLIKSDAFAKNNRLIICGDGPLRAELEKTAEELRSQNDQVEIVFTGFLPESEKKDYLATADVAVFPATGGESFGIVLIEAMAAGAGVVLAGNNPGYASVFAPIPEAVFEPNDISDFTALLAQASGDKEFIQKMHAKQKELVKKYDIETVGSQLVQEYKQAIASKNKTAHNNA